MTPMRLLAVLAGVALIAAAMPADAGATRLKSRITVSGDNIRVGDVFEDAGAAAGRVIGRAPPPGKRRMYDSRQLLRIAHDARLKWRPHSHLVTAMVRRASRQVGPEEIAAAIRDEMVRAGARGELEIVLGNRGTRIHVAAERPVGFEIANLRYDLGAGRFSAAVNVIGPDGPYQRSRVAGRVFSMVAVPVPSRGIRPGEVIREGDLRFQRVRSGRLANGALTDTAAIVGLSPRRVLRPGVPIRHGQLRRPVLVPKGSMVTLSLRTPVMALTAKARAAEDGARGDTIRVINTRSRRAVEAIVIGAGIVEVPPSGGVPALAQRR